MLWRAILYSSHGEHYGTSCSMKFQVQVQVDDSALPLPRCMTLADVRYLPGISVLSRQQNEDHPSAFPPCHFEMVYLKHLEQCLEISDTV